MTERTEQTIKVNVRFFQTSTQYILADSDVHGQEELKYLWAVHLYEGDENWFTFSNRECDVLQIHSLNKAFWSDSSGAKSYKMWCQHVNCHIWDNGSVRAGLATRDKRLPVFTLAEPYNLAPLFVCHWDWQNWISQFLIYRLCEECFGSRSRSFNTAATKNHAWCIRKAGHFDLLPLHHTSYAREECSKLQNCAYFSPTQFLHLV